MNHLLSVLISSPSCNNSGLFVFPSQSIRSPGYYDTSKKVSNLQSKSLDSSSHVRFFNGAEMFEKSNVKGLHLMRKAISKLCSHIVRLLWSVSTAFYSAELTVCSYKQHWTFSCYTIVLFCKCFALVHMRWYALSQDEFGGKLGANVRDGML